MDSLLNLHLNNNVGRTERIISTIAGSLLLIHGLRKGRKLSEIPLGSFLLFRGVTGHCPVRQGLTGNLFSRNGTHDIRQPHAVDIDASVTINKPHEEVYSFWRKLENLPLFMKHLDSVTVIDEKTSLWSAKIPGGFGTLDWESEITNDIQNERISWRSLPESEIKNSGNIRFIDLGNGKTEVRALIRYEAPAGIIGEKVGQLLNPIFEGIVRSDIKHLKKYLEGKTSKATDSFGERKAR